MKNILLLTIALMTALSINADNRSMKQMRDIAAATLNREAAVKGLRTRVKPATLQCVAEENALVIFTPQQEEGFVIVAKSDLVEPVVGYSTARYDADNMPPAFKWYLQNVGQSLQAIENGLMQAPRRVTDFTPVENFVTTTWSQDYPFDRKTPKNYPSGCIATALAQCLNYCQYPASAEFEGSYSVTYTKNKKEVTEEKTEKVSTTYTWPYKDNYKSRGSYGDNIDELLRDCGYATYMQYTAEASGSLVLYAAHALTEYFNYPEECIKYYDKDYFPDNQDAWNQIIYDEMMRHSPVLYGAHDPNAGGHAFLFSGLDAEGLVYVNWGWRGSADGFYAIELLDPKESGTQDHFTENHSMLTGIRPEPLETDGIQTRIWGYTGEPYTLRWGVTENEDGSSFHTLFADLPYGMINESATSFKGVFGLFGVDLTDGTEWVIAEELQDREEIGSLYGYAGTDEKYKDFYFYYDISGEKGLKPGHTYRMAFGTKDDREGTWHSILCRGGEWAYEITYTGDPETSTVNPEPISLHVATAIHAPLAAPENSNKLPYFFDLSGRRITEPAHGIFIHNGRKVVK